MGRLTSRVFLLLPLLVVLLACGGGNGDQSGPPEDTDILFMDDFSDSEARLWDIEQDSEGASFIQNGQMVLEIQTPNTIQFTTLTEPVFDDFTLDVDVIMLDGHPESSMGVLIRVQDLGRFYRFEIMADGRFMVEMRDTDGVWRRFVDDWLSAPSVVQGMRGTNHLRVVARGSQMAFFANDELLLEINDSAFSAGNIALDAGTFGHVPFRVAFDNLVISQP